MTKKQREYIDKDHKVMDTYYDLHGKYNGRNAESIKKQLKQLIKKDPGFLDTYLLLFDILLDEGDFEEADKVFNSAYESALKIILDKEGDWPDLMEWGQLQNRHILRTLLKQAILFWNDPAIDDALNLFRKLLKVSPGDNLGVRNFILAIRMNMSFEKFEKRFNKDGFYDMDLYDWFEKHYKKFPEEFDAWEKYIEKYM